MNTKFVLIAVMTVVVMTACTAQTIQSPVVKDGTNQAQDINPQEVTRHQVQTDSLYSVQLADFQNNAVGLSEYLNAINNPAYVDMHLKHDPKQTVVLFTDANTERRQIWFANLQDKFGKQLVLKQATISKTQADGEWAQISTIFNKQGIAMNGGYDIETERHQVSVDAADAERAAQLLKSLPYFSRIDIKAGALAVSEMGTP